jgi:hypothetical protein
MPSSAVQVNRCRKGRWPTGVAGPLVRCPAGYFHLQLLPERDMADLQQMSRVLYHHDWCDVHDWARNIDQLADLNDEEIAQLPRCCRADEDEAVRRPALPATIRKSIVERTRQGFAALCDGLRLSFRRAC